MISLSRIWKKGTLKVLSKKQNNRPLGPGKEGNKEKTGTHRFEAISICRSWSHLTECSCYFGIGTAIKSIKKNQENWAIKKKLFKMYSLFKALNAQQ